MLLNGEYMPDITMRPGEWQRLRLLQSSHNSALRIQFPAAPCKVILLAMDGTYLDSPRDISVTDPTNPAGFALTAGSRADVAIMCPVAGSYNVSSLTGGMQWSHVPLFKNFTRELYEPVIYPQSIATVVVAGEPVQMEPPTVMPPKSITQPLYPNLLDREVDAKYTVVYNLTAFGTEKPGWIPHMQDIEQALPSHAGHRAGLVQPDRLMACSAHEWHAALMNGMQRS